jgi:hypothetical protein
MVNIRYLVRDEITECLIDDLNFYAVLSVQSALCCVVNRHDGQGRTHGFVPASLFPNNKGVINHAPTGLNRKYGCRLGIRNAQRQST